MKYQYKGNYLTIIKSEDEILNEMVLHKYVYKQAVKILVENNKKIDFRKKLKKYNNVLEYVLIDLFLEARNYGIIMLDRKFFSNFLKLQEESEYLFETLKDLEQNNISKKGLFYNIGYTKNINNPDILHDIAKRITK